MTFRDLPHFRNLRDFLRHLEGAGDFRHISAPVSMVHEVTEIHRRVLQAGGPALQLDNARDAAGEPASMPVVVNLFGTVERVAAGFGVKKERLGELGEMMASLRSPQPPSGLRDAIAHLPMLKAALNTRPDTVRNAPCQAEVLRGADAKLSRLPIQTCWPGEPAPLISWPLVITRPPDNGSLNVGVYRLQVLDDTHLITRWLAHRGAAAHHRAWAKQGKDMPVAIVIGADPATILSAVMPIPETLSELDFAGLIRGERPKVVQGLTVPLPVPSEAEIVIEGYVSAEETAPEGPYGDHTGYYNAVEPFPVMRVTAITHRRDPLYLSTFTGRPPDEPSVMGEALNYLAKPLIIQQMPEISDVWLPPDACSYRLAIVSIKKRYPGQARRVMMGMWGMLPQFSYTKGIVVVDDDIDVHNGADVLWALSTRMDPSRDLVQLESTPIDYLDFASPEFGLGGKLGIDATNKIGAETHREWGTVLDMSPEVKARVDQMWPKLGLSGLDQIRSLRRTG
ncbi:4-hydroxy-3-polyprenylbenzoate decarboxylase [Rhodopseudomonas julia]|uniref:4-hydroxy-3-polyprenylbenzoate decarboxylase n=1 Tax=Rhodopseudomonas julia TaxID=200617 RepID=A0ABU0C633_9BRAD|nr:UbiD family decarboxylase [Rhodopseudomonas julia]MDQ0325978.1 4-hydroxy-3-polyprenylbenzoate decarboxylase [Rhodopseudomonas julia]